MVGAWLLITLVLVNSYASLLISALTVPKMKPVVDSFEDLVDSKQEGLTLAVNVDSVLGRFIMASCSIRIHKDPNLNFVTIHTNRRRNLGFIRNLAINCGRIRRVNSTQLPLNGNESTRNDSQCLMQVALFPVYERSNMMNYFSRWILSTTTS